MQGALHHLRLAKYVNYGSQEYYDGKAEDPAGRHGPG